MATTPSLKLVHRFRERLLAQTEIDADFSTFMFSFTDEGDKIRRKQMVAEYWGLQELDSSSGEEGLGSEEGRCTASMRHNNNNYDVHCDCNYSP